MTLEEAEEIVADTLARSHKGFQISTKRYFKACEVIDLHRGLDAKIKDMDDEADSTELEPSLPNKVEERSGVVNT